VTEVQLGRLELAVHQYVFEAEGRVVHVFYGIYEDQAGSRALLSRRLTPASRIEAVLAGSRNYGQRSLSWRSLVMNARKMRGPPSPGSCRS